MEKKLQLKQILKLVICVVFASLYAWGGIEHKWLRRFLAPIILTISMLGFSNWDWKTLIQMPFMFASLSLGYGATSLWAKILRRALFGLANGITSSGYNIIKKRWLLIGTQIVLLVGLFIVMGVFNPLGSARAEETFLGVMIALIPLMSIREK